MKKISLVFLFLCFLLVMYGMSGSSGKITASDVLSMFDKDSDIIKYKGRIYSNVTELEWFEEKKSMFHKGDKIGETKRQKKYPLFLRNLSATKLLKGTALYNTNDGKGGVIIVETENGDLLYYMMQLKE